MDKRINGNRIVFGYVNCVAFNRDPSGDYGSWYLTREARDEALEKFRAAMVRRGLSESSSRSGIYPVKMSTARVRVLCGDGAVE